MTHCHLKLVKSDQIWLESEQIWWVSVKYWAGAYYAGARTWPQLTGCALAQEPGCP